MKSIAILILGCLPLAVLTVWSFVEIGSIQSQLELETRNEGPPTRTLAPSPSSLAPFVEELAETDLLSGEPPAGLENLPEESSFAPVKDTWPKWTVARQMVGEFLEVERLTLATAPEPFEQAPLEDLDIAGERLAQFERTCELSKQKYQELKQDFQNSPSGGSPAPSGTGPLIALVDGRIAELDRRLDQCRKRLKAAELLAGARAAFQPQQYGECVKLCDELLSGYSSVLAPSEAAKVSTLRERAQFWHDTELLFSEWKRTDAPREREALLEAFLSKYQDRASRTAAEQRVLDARAQDLVEVKQQMEAQAADRAAEELIEALKQNLPAAFDDRLKSAVRIVDRYPTDSVKSTLRASARQWLRELLPEKRVTESPQLKEAETTRHEIVRGFFADVTDDDGTLFGYKRYPSLKALADPGFDVGTYRREEFLVPPGPSVPRRCLTRFHEARDRLIESPSRRTAWVELAGLCESLEAELGDYRKKKGAAQEDPDLSFDEEARFLRGFLAGPGWADMETLFGP